MARHVDIPIEGLWPFETCAQVLGLLAHPQYDDDRQRFIDAVCFLTLCEAGRDPSAKNVPITLPPRYVAIGIKDAEKLHEQGTRLLQDRMIAAQMVYPYLIEAVTGRRFRGLRADGEPIGALNLDTLCTWGLRQQRRLRSKPDKASGISNQVRQRLWRSSKPVLGLAVALSMSCEASSPEAWRDRAGALFSDPHQTRELLSLTETARLALLAIAPGRFELREADTIGITCGPATTRCGQKNGASSRGAEP